MTRTMSVQVKECQLRARPSFLSRIVTRLFYTDQVSVEQEKGDWVEVTPAHQKNRGWVHISALSEKKIVLKQNSRDINNTASSDELALAGKGFNEQVENDFRKQNKDIDFTWVDKMEKISISTREMQKFLQQGGLKAEGGDA